MRFLVLIIAALAPLLTPVAQAQDLPGRVGRLAFIEGQVSLYHDPDAGWERARINYPLTSENSLWTDRGSRAEMRVSGISIRLAETTQLDLARLDDDELNTFVAQGSINVRVRQLDAGQRLDFSTPHARFRLLGVGRYRIDVDAQSDESTLTVFAGSATLRGSRGNVQVRAGNALRIYGGSQSSYNFERASVTAFDRWSSTRDERWRDARSTRYVSTYMTGYEDLDAHGEWVQEPGLGALWFPTRVERDWAPYRYGRWENIRPWGWTWVDDAPWGYAPFHYGRWVHVRDRWAWHPGERENRPAWAPALVSWVGGTASASAGASPTPTVGWYPLSPWDRYQPWYNASPTYVSRVNVIVRSEPPRQDRQAWREYGRTQGATVVRREQFAESRPINQAALRLAPEATRSLQAIAPTQALPPVSEIRTRRAQVQAQQAPAAAPPAPRTPAAAAPAPAAPAAGAPSTAAPAAPRVQPPDGERGNRGNERGDNRGNRGDRDDRGSRGNAPVFQRQPAIAEPVPANPEAAKGVPGPKPATRPLDAAKGTAPQAPAQDAQRQQQERAAQEQERAAREGQRQQQEKGARDAQQQQEKAARETQQQQQQEKAAREGQQQRDRQQQEKAARDAQQQQEKAARETQQQQEKAAREGQQQRDRQQQEKAARDAQQQQEKAARDAQQQQEKAAREGQQQRERQQQEKAARETQQQQEKAAREGQQQRERQQQEKAARDAQQQEKAKRDAQQRAAPTAPATPAAPAVPAVPAATPAVPATPAQPAVPAPPPQPPAAPGKGRPRDKDRDEKEKEEKDKKDKKDKEEKDKGKAR